LKIGDFLSENEENGSPARQSEPDRQSEVQRFAAP
jgi:hypothetical protein